MMRMVIGQLCNLKKNIYLNIKANVLLNKHNSTDNVMSIEWLLIDSLIVWKTNIGCLI